MLKVNPEQIPIALKRRPHWTTWRVPPTAEGKKPKKLPYHVRTGKLASCTDPSTWSSFDEAVDALPNYDGLNIALTGDGLVGIDLDHCIDDGVIAEWARAIMTLFNSYTERSPSRLGLRIFVRGMLPPGRRHRGSAEVYDRERFLSVTGDHVQGTPFTIEARDAQLAQFHAEHFPRPIVTNRPTPVPVSVGDEEILQQMFNAKNGATIRQLWSGDFSAYPSQSEGDLALCNHLAFWFACDEARIDALFRRSALYRPKWDEGKATTYGRRTIAVASAGCLETYQPRERGDASCSAENVNAKGGADGDIDDGLTEDVMPQVENHNRNRLDSDEPNTALSPLFMDAQTFLAQRLPPTTFYIHGLLSNDGGGWIAGEEKLGKTFWILHEAVCLALGLPVAGRFGVPMARRVVIIEEEDSPRRTQRRLRAIIAGLGVDPDDSEIQAQLAERLHLAVWTGFTFDDAAMVERLDVELALRRPDICYIDVLRKITTMDLNKGECAGKLLSVLDDLRRRHGTLFRIIAHNRKGQPGGRVGRGSREIAGSHVLGAWGENSLFFAPIGTGLVKITVQSKDLPPSPPFRLVIESEGASEDPTMIHLRAEDWKTTSAAEASKERVYEALTTLSPDDLATLEKGRRGISIRQLMKAVKRSDKTVRKDIKCLIAEGRCLEVGTLSKGGKLYEVKPL